MNMYIDMQHGYGNATWTWKCRMDMDMDMQRGYRHAAWTMDLHHRHVHTCMDVDMQHGAWKCSMDVDMDILYRMAWTCCMDMDMQHGDGHTA